jgi:hypothetical protein
VNIPYASPIVRATIDGSNAATHLDELEDALVAAEWDLESSVLATQTGVFTGLPSNTQTVTIGATVYRFVNTLSAAFDVLIGVLEHKRRESEQVAQKMPKQDEFDFEWHDPEVRL